MRKLAQQLVPAQRRALMVRRVRALPHWVVTGYRLLRQLESLLCLPHRLRILELAAKPPWGPLELLLGRLQVADLLAAELRKYSRSLSSSPPLENYLPPILSGRVLW